LLSSVEDSSAPLQTESKTVGGHLVTIGKLYLRTSLATPT
jgi:hypothetical protein